MRRRISETVGCIVEILRIADAQNDSNIDGRVCRIYCKNRMHSVWGWRLATAQNDRDIVVLAKPRCAPNP